MTFLHTIQLLLCVCALAAFGWGMACFFQTPSGRARHARHTRTVGMLALGFAAWHLWAVAASTAVWWWSLAAIGLYSLSIGLFAWAVRACGPRPPMAIFETEVPGHLIREGPYRYVRHPFYTAYILFWIAGWIASRSWIALGSVVVMSAMYVRAATEEEATFRRSSLAADHAEYRRRTGFMMPRRR